MYYADPIVVGYERTVYTTEGEGRVTLCAIITSPVTGGTLRSFTLSASTTDNTTGKAHICMC